jgi:hypothetical protein
MFAIPVQSEYSVTRQCDRARCRAMACATVCRTFCDLQYLRPAMCIVLHLVLRAAPSGVAQGAHAKAALSLRRSPSAASSGASPPPGPRACARAWVGVSCRGAWARVTIDQFRHLAMQNF